MTGTDPLPLAELITSRPALIGLGVAGLLLLLLFESTWDERTDRATVTLHPRGPQRRVEVVIHQHAKSTGARAVANTAAAVTLLGGASLSAGVIYAYAFNAWAGAPAPTPTTLYNDLVIPHARLLLLLILVGAITAQIAAWRNPEHSVFLCRNRSSIRYPSTDTLDALHDLDLRVRAQTAVPGGPNGYTYLYRGATAKEAVAILNATPKRRDTPTTTATSNGE